MGDHIGFISSISFNPDGTRLASVDSIGAIKLWHGKIHDTSSSKSNEFDRQRQLNIVNIHFHLDLADSWKLEVNLDFAELQVK